MSNPPSKFPTDLDTDVNLKTVVDQNLPSVPGDDVIALHHNILKNCVKKIEEKIGIDNSAVVTSLDYLLTNPASDEPGHTHSSSVGNHTFDDAVHTDVNAMTEATGDIIYRTAGSLWERLPIGTNLDILTIVGGIPEWTADPTLDSLAVPIINAATDLKLQSIGIADLTVFEDQLTDTQRYFIVFAPNSGAYVYMFHDKTDGHINSSTGLKIQSDGVGDASFFEDQLTATQRYLQIFAPNSANYLYLYHDGTDGRIDSSSGSIKTNDSFFTSLQIVAGDPQTGDTKGITLTGGSGSIEIWRQSDGVPFIDFKTDFATDYDARLQKTAAHGFLIKVGGSGSIVTAFDLDAVGGVALVGTEGSSTRINTFSTDGTMAGNSDDAVPTEQAVVEYITDIYATENVDFTYQMQMEPFDGATWTYLNGLSILIDADTEKIHAVGSIPDGATQFKIKVYYEHNGASDTTYMQFKIDGKEDSDTSLSNYYDVTAEWATTSANEEDIKDSGWETLDAGDERIIVELERITAGGTDDIYIHAIVIEFRVPALVLNTGSQALTDLRQSLAMEPYDGATWSDENGLAIHLNAANEKVLAAGHIPPDTTQFRILVFAQHDDVTDSSTITTTIKGQECSETSITTYATDASAWATTSANEQYCKTLGWYAVDADQERIFVQINWDSGDDIFINDVILECRTPVGTYYTAATLSSSLPADMPAAGTAGVSDDVSRADHVHPRTDTVTMAMEPFGGSAWTTDVTTYCITCNAAGEGVHARGAIRPGYDRFRVRVIYAGGNATTSSFIYYQDTDSCGDTTTNSDTSLGGAWAACGVFDDVNVETSDWISITNTKEYWVGAHFSWTVGPGAIYVLAMYLELDTESS